MKVFILLVVALGCLSQIEAGCSIRGQVFCDHCWDGKYTPGMDSNLGGVDITVNCTVKSGSSPYHYWGHATTNSDGTFTATIVGASDLLGKSDVSNSFLTSLYKNGDVKQGERSDSSLVGCDISTSNGGTCPTLSLDNGDFRTDGRKGNGWTSSNCGLRKGSSTSDVYIGNNGDDKNSISLTPIRRKSNCPVTPPPPPGSTGDPHFTGADGSHYDFTGEPGNTYCLLSDSHIHVNAYYGGRFDRWGDNPHKALTWIRKLGILWGSHKIVLEAREGARWQYGEGYMAKIEVDGRQVSLKREGESFSVVNGAIEISWLAAKLQSADDLVDVYLVKIDQVAVMRLTLRPEIALLRTPQDGVIHFDIELPKADISNKAHGVMGQTFRSDHRHRLEKQELVYSKLFHTHVVPGENAEGFLDGKADDYVSSGLLKADCKVARFNRALHRAEGILRGVQLVTGKASSAMLSVSRKFLKSVVNK